MLNRSLVIIIPIFMKAKYHILIPWRQHATIIVSPPVSLDDDYMLFVFFTNSICNIHHQLFQRLILFFFQPVFIIGGVFKSPVGFINDIIGTHPGFISITLSKFLP